jgi:hypothetical protein
VRRFRLGLNRRTSGSPLTWTDILQRTGVRRRSWLFTSCAIQTLLLVVALVLTETWHIQGRADGAPPVVFNDSRGCWVMLLLASSAGVQVAMVRSVRACVRACLVLSSSFSKAARDPPPQTTRPGQSTSRKSQPPCCPPPSSTSSPPALSSYHLSTHLPPLKVGIAEPCTSCASWAGRLSALRRIGMLRWRAGRRERRRRWA